MTDNNSRIRVGSKLKLGDGDTYEIVDFYYTTESGYWNGIVEIKDSGGKVDAIPMDIVYELLRDGHLYRPESKFSEEYYQKIVKPRLDKQKADGIIGV